MPVKSIDVPEVEACDVPDVITLAPITGVPLIVGLVSVELVSVGDVRVSPDAKYVEFTAPAVAGMAFSTEDT